MSKKYCCTCVPILDFVDKHNSPLANDLEVLFQYETDNIDQVESCIKYRKYVLIKILFMNK